MLCYASCVLELAACRHVVEDVREEGDQAHVLAAAELVEAALADHLLDPQRDLPGDPLSDRPRLTRPLVVLHAEISPMYV